MLLVTLPRRCELLTPGVVRHLPRCRLFPLIASAARLGRGPPVRSLRDRADLFRPLGTGSGRGPSGSSRYSGYARTRVRCRVRSDSESSMRAALADTAPRPVASRLSCSARAVVAPGPPIRRVHRPGPGRRVPAANRGPGRLGVGCGRGSVPPRQYPAPPHAHSAQGYHAGQYPAQAARSVVVCGGDPPSLPSRGPPMCARGGAATRIRQPTSRV